MRYHSIEDIDGVGWRKEAPVLDAWIDNLMTSFVKGEITFFEYVPKIKEHLEIAKALNAAHLLSNHALSNYETINQLVLEHYKDYMEDKENGIKGKIK